MIGIQNGNDFWNYYMIITLLILGGFAFYDIKYHKVKNKALLCFLPWCCIAIVHSFSSSFFGFVCGTFVIVSTAILGKSEIGGGDIKLTALLGIIFGPYGILIILMLACLLALGICMPMKEKRIPFVPFLSISCCILFIVERGVIGPIF